MIARVVAALSLLVAAATIVHAQDETPKVQGPVFVVPADTLAASWGALGVPAGKLPPICGMTPKVPTGGCLSVELQVCTGTQDELGNCLSGCCPPKTKPAPKPVKPPKAPPAAMALVGLHLVKKADSGASSWVWATFEHTANAAPQP